MKTMKSQSNNLRNSVQSMHRMCVRDRAVTFKDLEIEEEIPASTIPIIEEILADILFSAFVREKVFIHSETMDCLEECCVGDDRGCNLISRKEESSWQIKN